MASKNGELYTSSPALADLEMSSVGADDFTATSTANSHRLWTWLLRCFPWPAADISWGGTRAAPGGAVVVVPVVVVPVVVVPVVVVEFRL